METRAEKLLRFFQFYGSFTGPCKDRFVAEMAFLRERYEHHVADLSKIKQRYADVGVDDFEKDFFPRIDMHALEFFVMLSVRKAVADTLVDIQATLKQQKDALTVLTQEHSFFFAHEQAWLTAVWVQGEEAEPELFLFYSLERSASDQLEKWPRNWRTGTGAVTWDPQLWARIHEMVSGSLAKDWHKFDWWQAIEDMLRDQLLSRGLTRQAASHLIAFTWQHFFPEEMTGWDMAAAMRGRWRNEQEK